MGARTGFTTWPCRNRLVLLSSPVEGSPPLHPPPPNSPIPTGSGSESARSCPNTARAPKGAAPGQTTAHSLGPTAGLPCPGEAGGVRSNAVARSLDRATTLFGPCRLSTNNLTNLLRQPPAGLVILGLARAL